jgi:transposase-like protein
MPLSSNLRHVELTLQCKYCGHSIIKKGVWFVVIHRFTCEGCNRQVPMTYSDKVALFNKYAAPSRPKLKSSPG